MNIVRKHPAKLSVVEYDACQSLTFDATIFNMRKVLNKCHLNESTDAVCYCMWNGETLVSWAIVHNMRVDTFTHRDHRRKGYGAKVLERVKQDFPNVTGSGWSDMARSLYTKTGIAQ